MVEVSCNRHHPTVNQLALVPGFQQIVTIRATDVFNVVFQVIGIRSQTDSAFPRYYKSVASTG
jgi:hypothetical protein